MKKIVLSVAVISSLAVNTFADDISDLKAQIKALSDKVNMLEKKQVSALNDKVNKIEKKQKRIKKTLTKVKKHDAYDNIKWNVDFRTAYDSLNYKLKGGGTVSNPSMLSSRLWLGMEAAPTDKLTFEGQLAEYNTWGGNSLPATDLFQNVNWRASSKADDLTLKVRRAYFVYKLTNGKYPVSLSAGRRAASDGFLANHREALNKPGSPLAHITNMEVDGAMVRIGNAFGLDGSYVKFVVGRSYTNINQYSFMGTPYTTVNATDKNVDFFVIPMGIYNDGQYNLMAQYTFIDNFMGANKNLVDPKKNPAGATTGAGSKHMGAVSLQIDGLDEDIDFLDNSTFFASGAFTTSDPKNGYTMLGSNKSQTGYSFWTGFIFPDTITEDGRIGLEYNHGSKYWAPMTWAEDTMTSSKIATRGNAYEAYWNLPFDDGHFITQLRYTYMDFKYKSNIEEFWASPDLQTGDAKSAQDIRLSVSYRF